MLSDGRGFWEEQRILNNVTIGILALQGSVIEHRSRLEQIAGVTVVEVKKTEEIDRVDGIILPGGESTTIGKLLREFGLFAPLKARIEAGMPVWGTCAGLILLAKEIVNEPAPHLAVMDIAVRRNAYGSQLDSFATRAAIPEVAKEEIPLVFIRAPWIERVGQDVTVLCRVDGQIVAARQGNMLATSFHPELTADLSFHGYFVNMVQESRGN